MSQERGSISSSGICPRLQRDGPPLLRLEISSQILGVNLLSTTCDNRSFAKLCSFLDLSGKCCLLWSRNTLVQSPFPVDMILVLVFAGESREVSVRCKRRRRDIEWGGDADGLTPQQTHTGS